MLHSMKSSNSSLGKLDQKESTDMEYMKGLANSTFPAVSIS
jgi:hypothetical protein